MTDRVTHHAVEEESRLTRVIMQKTKVESAESIRIMQEHNWVINFFKNKLIAIENRMNLKFSNRREQLYLYNETIQERLIRIRN
jgi:transcriptional regulatory protein LevR